METTNQLPLIPTGTSKYANSSPEQQVVLGLEEQYLAELSKHPEYQESDVIAEAAHYRGGERLVGGVGIARFREIFTNRVKPKEWIDRTRLSLYIVTRYADFTDEETRNLFNILGIKVTRAITGGYRSYEVPQYIKTIRSRYANQILENFLKYADKRRFFVNKNEKNLVEQKVETKRQQQAPPPPPPQVATPIPSTGFSQAIRGILDLPMTKEQQDAVLNAYLGTVNK